MQLLDDWREEKRSAYLYRIMAEYEKNLAHKTLFLDLASAADKQAEIWAKKITVAGSAIPDRFIADLRTRLVGWLIKRLGTQRLRLILPSMKVRGMAIYLDEPPSYPFKSAHIKDHERRHKGLTNGGNLRAAVFGINDGLVSNTSLLLGIAGAASTDHKLILLSGIAGLLAGASSMAAGEYISVRSQRELYEYQIELERNELELYPEEEMAELAMIYQARGLPKEQAKQLAASMISNPEKALDTLAKEELGLNPNELASPWGAAISSFIAFSIGAAIPLAPYLLGNHPWNLPTMISLVALSLFSIGAILSLFTNRNAILSGLRMLLIGTAAGIVTYFVGSLLGVALN